MNEFATAHPNFDTFAVVGDALGTGQRPETVTDIRAFVSRYHVKYPISATADTGVANDYKTWGYPSIVFIRKDGTIEYNIAGYVPYAALAAAAKQTIADNGKLVRPGPVVFPTP